MIVALGASGGEGKKCSRRYIDPVVARLRRKRQKTESGEHFFTVFAGQQIRRQLGFYEAVIRQVPVEGLDDPIPVAKCVGRLFILITR